MRLLTTFVALAVICAGAGLAQPSGTFRHAHDVGSGEFSSLDPISKGRVLQITEKIMNRLVRPAADGTPQPDLATQWQANADGTVWTLKLRDGVRFHDGSDFDAADVVYSLNRILDPEVDSPARSVVKMVQRVMATDRLTVRLVLESTFADLPLQLMDPRLRMIPEGSGDTIARTGIGTGPFRVEKFDPDGITVLAANTDYWEGEPYIARMEIIGVPDAQARLQAFLAGQLDMERGIAPLMRRALGQSDRYNVQEIPTGNWSGFVFRTDVPPFDDPRVRKALRLAADREELLKLAQDGGGIVSCDTPVAPNDQYRSNRDCPQDIETARTLLEEAGYGHGLEVDLHISTIDQSWVSMAVAYQEQAEGAGILVNVIKASADGYWSEVWRQKDAFASSWGARPADQILNEAYHSEAKWNESYMKDQTFDGLMAAARNELDFDKRRQLYIAAQEYLWENSGTLIPYHRTQLVGLSKRVRNIDPVKSDAVRWHMVELVDDSS